MSSHATLSAMEHGRRLTNHQTAQGIGRRPPVADPIHLTAHAIEEEAGHRQAELFYLQKQIQSQTPMVIVLQDGEHIEGCIEWYDRGALKVRGRAKILVYKSAIKYMYKLGESGK